MLGVPPPQRLEWAPSVVSTSCRAGARSARIIVRLPSSMPPHRGVRGVEAVIERFISVRHRRLSLASLTVPAGQRPRRVGRRQSGHTCPIFSTHILDKLVSTLSQKVPPLPPGGIGIGGSVVVGIGIGGIGDIGIGGGWDRYRGYRKRSHEGT